MTQGVSGGSESMYTHSGMPVRSRMLTNSLWMLHAHHIVECLSATEKKEALTPAKRHTVTDARYKHPIPRTREENPRGFLETVCGARAAGSAGTSC